MYMISTLVAIKWIELWKRKFFNDISLKFVSKLWFLLQTCMGSTKNWKNVKTMSKQNRNSVLANSNIQVKNTVQMF